MNKKDWFFIFVIFIVLSNLVISCTGGMYELLSRPPVMPILAAPLVDSLISENTIILRWSEDTAADEYILWRAPDEPSPVFSKIWNGQGSYFIDSRLPDKNQYIYRLDRRRGNKNFVSKEYGFGVSTDLIRDIHEPNDSKESATYLESDREANIFFYRSQLGHTIEDVDWYYVTIPPRRQVELKINRKNLLIGQTVTGLDYTVEMTETKPVTQNDSIFIVNYDFVPQRRNIRISPDRDFFVNPGESGGLLVTYTISLVKVEIF